MKKRIISIILFVAFCSSFFLPNFSKIRTTYASPISPPTGWAFSDTNQKIPVTLKGVTYYAYELKKMSSSTAGGWLITDSNNRIIYDSNTYQKLALTATVAKTLNDKSNQIIIQNELSLLKAIKWRIDIYESTTAISKIIINISTALTGNLFGLGGIEELFATALVPLKSREGDKVQDKLFVLFSKDFVADATPYLSKALSIIGRMSTSNSEKWLKVFGALNIILRREAASFSRGGYEAYKEAYEIAKKNRSSWSYEDASVFLNKFEEGRTRGIPFAKWYLTLIPHNSNQLKNIGNVIWKNILKETVSGLSSGTKNIANFTVGAVDAGALSKEFITRTFSAKLITSDLSDDIKKASLVFSIYRLYYDVSINGSLASQILSALQEQKAKEEASVKNKTIYKIGDRIQATDYLNVRENPSLNGKVKSVIKKGEIGTIMSNYIIANGYRWWTVKWDNGPQGWCAGEYMKHYTSTTKDYYFSSVTIKVNINKDGSFDVIEKRTYKFIGAFSWGTYWLQKSGFSSLENFKISDESSQYINNSSGNPGTYSFTEDSNKYTATYYYSALNEQKTFTFSYKINGGIKVYQDVADFNWKLVGTGWDKKTDYFEAYVYLPSKVNENELYVFGHGPTNGIIEKIDGSGAHYKLTNLPPNTYVEARVVFPSNILSTTKMSQNGLDSILTYENKVSSPSKNWVLVLGDSLSVLDGISPAGYAVIAGECKEEKNCWKTLSEVHAGDFLEYISTDSATYSTNLFLPFPGCTKAYRVKDKNGNVGWLIGEWGGVTLAQVVNSKTKQNFKPVSFSKISGKWSGHWRGTFFEQGELSFVFQQEDMLTFSGTGILTFSGSDMTRNVIVKGSIVNNSFYFLEVQPDGSYKYCSGTISSDGKTIDGWKNSYDTLAIPLGEFKLTFQGG